MDTLLAGALCQCAQERPVLRSVSRDHHQDDDMNILARIWKLASLVLTMQLGYRRVRDGLSHARTRTAWPAPVTELLPGDPACATQMLGVWLDYLAHIKSDPLIYMQLVVTIFQVTHSFPLAGWFKTPALLTWIHFYVTRYQPPSHRVTYAHMTSDRNLEAVFTCLCLSQQLHLELFQSELVWLLTRRPHLPTRALSDMLVKGFDAITQYIPDALPASMRQALRRSWAWSLAHLLAHTQMIIPRHVHAARRVERIMA